MIPLPEIPTVPSLLNMPTVDELWEPMKLSVPTIFSRVHDIVTAVSDISIDWEAQIDADMSVALFLPTDYNPPRYSGAGGGRAASSGSSGPAVAEDAALQMNESKVRKRESM